MSWLNTKGDTIKAREAIMVVDSDKADMEVKTSKEIFPEKIFTRE